MQQKSVLGLCCLVGVLLVGSLPLNAATPTVEKPKGIFSSSGYRSDKVLNHPDAGGVLIRIPWQKIEPLPGKFNFEPIESQRAAIVKAGKKWSLTIHGGPSSPAWLYREPFKVKTIEIHTRSRTKPAGLTHIPQFWDPQLLERLDVLAQALGRKYNDDESLALVYVPQMTANGSEGHFNGTPYQSLRDQGFTSARWVTASTTASRMFAKAFSKKPIAFEVHEMVGDAAIPKQIMDELWADKTLDHRVGVGVWWLSGKEKYQSKLLKVLKQYPGDIYAQVIGRSDQTRRFANGDYSTVFKQAQELGIRYIEVWEYELKNDDLKEQIKAFNEWAAVKYP